MRIIAYTYEADVHCPDCTARAWAAGRLIGNPCQGQDEHTLPYSMVDREGNPTHPVFSTDEQEHPEYCGDCHAPIL